MGKIIIYDDEPIIVRQLKSGIRTVKLTPIDFTDLSVLRNYIYSDENWDGIQALILDLAQAFEAESGTNKFEILEDIWYCYHKRRVPILIHSGFAELVEEFQNLPKMFLYKKGGRTIRAIRNDLETMKTSGFLDLFSEGCLLNDEVRILNEKTGLAQELLKQLIHDEFDRTFPGNAELLEELREICENSSDEIKRMTYLKYLAPITQKILSDNGHSK